MGKNTPTECVQVDVRTKIEWVVDVDQNCYCSSEKISVVCHLKAMSSRVELHARSVKRMKKKQQRLSAKLSRPEDPLNYVRDHIETMLPIPVKRTSVSVLPKKNKGKPIKSAPTVVKVNPAQLRKSPAQLKRDFTNADPFTKKFWVSDNEGEVEPSEELKAVRKEIGVLVKGNLRSCPAPVKSIHDPNLPKIFVKICAAHKVTKPSPVQMQCWPPILFGANLLGIAPTGSGKTLAYCLPAVPHILAELDAQKQVHVKRKFTPQNGKFLSPIVLILVPTRELAVQVVSVLKPLKRICGITSGAVYGGVDKNEQLQKLKAACSNGLADANTAADDKNREKDKQLHILVATPGRLQDFLFSASAGNSVQLEVSRVTYLVIDEADRMLNMGFQEQLNAISSCIRPDRQTMLFSATFPGRLREASELWMQEPVIVRCSAMEFQDHNNAGKEGDEATDATVDEENGEEADDVDSESSADNDDDDEVEVEENEEVPETDNTADATEEPKAKKAKKSKIDSVDAETAKNTSANSSSSLAAVVATGGMSDAKMSSLTISHSVKQKIHVCASHKKPRLLLKYITQCRETEKIAKVRQAGPMIIFCNKIKTLKFVHDFLKRQNVRADALHGQLAQHIREAILANFKAVSSCERKSYVQICCFTYPSYGSDANIIYGMSKIFTFFLAHKQNTNENRARRISWSQQM